MLSIAFFIEVSIASCIGLCFGLSIGMSIELSIALEVYCTECPSPNHLHSHLPTSVAGLAVVKMWWLDKVSVDEEKTVR